MKRISLLWVLLLALVVGMDLLSCGSGGESSPNLLDSTFGSGGKAITAIGTVDDTAYALAVQSDGKLVGAGYTNTGIQTSCSSLSSCEFALVRYNTDGTSDFNFGTGGIVRTNINDIDDEVFALAVQSDGKLVAAGYSYDNSLGQYVFSLARYNTDGSPDTTFGTGFGTGDCTSGGCVTTPIGTIDDKVYALAVQSDQKLVVAGATYNGTDYDFALARYNTDGSLDTSFNAVGTKQGVVTLDIAGQVDAAYALAIQSDGKIVAAGYSYDSGLGQNVFALARYNTDGSLDTTFNPCPCLPGHTAGIVTTAIGTTDSTLLALALQTDGKLIGAGYSDDGSRRMFALIRYNTDGSLDAAFGAGGIVTTAFGTVSDNANALAIQSNGKVIAAGYTTTNSNYKFALARYNTNGSLDPTFNGTGKITTAVGGNDSAQALALQADGKFVAAGYSLQTYTKLIAPGNSVQVSQYEFALVRYLAEP